MLSACSLGKMAMKKADKKFNYGEYELAIQDYTKAIERNHEVGEAYFQIGESYRLSNRLKRSETFYKQAIDHNYADEATRLYYAQSLTANEKYDQATQVLNQLIDQGEDEQYLQLARWQLDNIRRAQPLYTAESYFRVRNLSSINTSGAEYSPVYQDGELYFTTSRYGGKTYKATGTAFTDLYKAKTRGALVDTTTLTSVGDEINDPDTNEGSITFAPDGRTMVFAKGNSGKRRGADDVNLYISRYRRSGWSTPELMRINDPKSWDSSPAFSRDGRTLFFASNRRGGYGGTDLYAATKNRRGNFSSVRNLGEMINTPGNEMFPYQGADGSLYFSSTGHPGLGQLDIFVATREEGEMKIRNLGPPINSSADDFGLFQFTPDKGFFTSNREGGKGDDDIYTFINNDPDLKIVNYFLTGTTVSYDDEGNEILLPNAAVSLFGAEEELLDEAITGRDGKFSFRVFPEEDYVLIGEKPDYFTTRASFTTKGRSVPVEELSQLVTNKTFETRIVLDQIVLNKSIVLENIYYDLDKWDIRTDAARELDKLVTVLDDNPEIRIELSSHTDSRASADYNDELSKKRAQSAVDYIVSRGISRDRLIARGYGESQLIISDEKIAQMPTEEAREAAHQRNRRTEFKVIEYNRQEEEPEEIEDSGEITQLEAEEIIESGDEGDLENKIDWDN
jgi:outer membrane protein OmpA-like peptidoglycan-associated protein